jgi:hypothetical protein
MRRYLIGTIISSHELEVIKLNCRVLISLRNASYGSLWCLSSSESFLVVWSGSLTLFQRMVN